MVEIPPWSEKLLSWSKGLHALMQIRASSGPATEPSCQPAEPISLRHNPFLSHTSQYFLLIHVIFSSEDVLLNLMAKLLSFLLSPMSVTYSAISWAITIIASAFRLRCPERHFFWYEDRAKPFEAACFPRMRTSQFTRLYKFHSYHSENSDSIWWKPTIIKSYSEEVTELQSVRQSSSPRTIKH